MRKNRVRDLRRMTLYAAVFAAAIAFTPAARAQQTQGADTQSAPNQTPEPIPAYNSPYSPGPDETQNPENVQPDTRPLSGAQYLSVGNLKTSRSYWEPMANITGIADSNPDENASGADWGGWGTFLGGVDIYDNSGISKLTLTYLGGGSYSNESDVQNGAVQDLAVIEQLSFRRAVLSFLDVTDYMPNSMSGVGGIVGLPQGAGSTNLGTGFVNGQTILSGAGQSLNNTSVVELNTFLTPRSSITFEGGYSLLHFFGNSLIDSGELIFQGGYNYQLSRHDTLAFFYAFNQFRFNDINQLVGNSSSLTANSSASIDTHSIEASFGRRVTGRLAFQVAGGPEISVLSNGAGIPTNSGGAGVPNTGSSVQLNWTLNPMVTYQYQRTTLDLTYAHGVFGGSGVLLGSTSDIVTGTVARRMSQRFSSNFSAGWAANKALSGTGVQELVQNINQNYSYWFAGATFARPLSEALALTFSYELQYQNSNNTFCIETSCGTSLVRNLISVGLSWNQHPMSF